MPEFNTGEQKTAIVPMANPTVKAFDYMVQLYMGTDLAVMSEASFHLEPGETKDIAMPVTMPDVVGTYPVYIGVFSDGVNIVLYKTIEDVVITVLPSFVFSNVSSVGVVCKAAPAFATQDFSCLVANPTDETITRTLKLMRLYRTYPRTEWSGPYEVLSFDLTLLPGQTYQCSIEGNYYEAGEWYCRLIIPTATISCLYLEDEYGNQSVQACV